MASYLAANELRVGTVFRDGNDVHSVVKYDHIKKARAQAVIKVKVRNVETGAVTEQSYSSDTKLEDVDVYKRSAQYLYADGQSLYFMDAEDFSQFSLSKDSVSEPLLLLEGDKVIVAYLEDRPLSVELPATVELEVTHAPEVVVGGTVSNPSKEIELETGLKMQAPVFVKSGDKIKINTADITYISRV